MIAMQCAQVPFLTNIYNVMASSAKLDNAGNDSLPLCAHLTGAHDVILRGSHLISFADIQVKDPPKVRTSYVVVIYVDGEKKFKSKKKTNGSPTQWQEDHQL
jgi:hypothetical protein